ncbi:hypothetical protein Godav_025771 [Gossypium davidsonii]|uniref:DUF7745 domain-containing protein n=2 Tax=Gossypium davidsonii TaxID=34287 RepID=A0A7J8TA70_GOSDV|nr:hypothetical protein [Gossypium davidsonii]
MVNFTLLSGSEKLVLREVFTSVQGSGSLSRYIRTYVFMIFSSPCSHREMYSPEPNLALVRIWLLDRKFILGNGFIDRMEDNAAVRTWAEMTQREKGDSLAEGYVDNRLFRAFAQFWNPAYSCFTFGRKISVNVPTFLKSLKDLILALLDANKKVDIFALSIYGLVVFPWALEHVDEAVTDLFDRLDKRVTPVSAILAETFRSLNACRREGEGRFIGCAQLLLAWFHSHFWKVDKVLYWEEDIEWRAPWLLPDEILYRSRQFVPATHGLAECEFSYRGDGYKKRIYEIVSAWGQTHRMKRLAVGPMTTPEYSEWWVRRINDNIPGLRSENSQSIEEHLRVVPTELEIIKQDFERKNTELEKKIEQMEEEKVNLRLDVDVQKLEADKLRKGKN